MTLNRLKWLTYLIPPLLLGGLELLRQVFAPDLFESRWLYLAFIVVALAGMSAFAFVVGRQVEQAQQHLVHQNRELLALHHASLAISSDLNLETVLQRVVDAASTLVGARYGAISCDRLVAGVDTFITHGISDAERALIGPPPDRHGLLGVVLSTGETLRLDHVAGDPRASGYPPHHPRMARLLAVPIATSSGVVGNLYLADKRDLTAFSEADEHTLTRFAALAAIAIENAVLHGQVQVLAISGERERIAREMHDSLAQVLAWVNTKSQAAMTHLDRGDAAKARSHLDQLAAAAREAYVDVREGIFALRSATAPADRDVFDVLAGYVERWQDQHGIPVTFTVEGPPATLSDLAGLHLLRLVQEALTNIRKHASATCVSVTVHRGNVQLELVIRDDGTGFDPGAITRGNHPRFGLATMRERAEASGGTFELESAPGKGTTIRVTLPARPV